MPRYRTRIIFTIVISFIYFLQTSSSSGVPTKHHFRSPRSVSEDARKCGEQWRQETSDDPHFAGIHVSLHNKASSVKKMSAALRCLTMEKLGEPKSAFKVAPGKTQEVPFRIAVSSKSFHYDPSVRQHECQLSTWTEDANSLVTCQFNISVWPNGMFYYKCSQYKQDQLSISQSTISTNRQINLINTEHRSIYVINSTCEPEVPTLQHVDMYKQLDAGQTWTLEFPLSCSGATSLNYHGRCSIQISHVCREVTTKVKDIKFDFQDGEIEECEHVKSKFGKPASNSFAESFGVNDDEPAVLVIVIITEILLIIGTLVMKFTFVGFTKDWDSAKTEFRVRFRNFVGQARSMSRVLLTIMQPKEKKAGSTDRSSGEYEWQGGKKKAGYKS